MSVSHVSKIQIAKDLGILPEHTKDTPDRILYRDILYQAKCKNVLDKVDLGLDKVLKAQHEH